jgi:hypothetical protein
MIEERPEDDEGDDPDIIGDSMDERSLSVEEASQDARADDSYTITKPDTAPRRASKLTKTVSKQRIRQQSRPDCGTTLSHDGLVEDRLSNSRCTRKGVPRCSTTPSHNRQQGLWRRGSSMLPRSGSADLDPTSLRWSRKPQYVME